MLAGRYLEDGAFESGFFDKDSFQETLGGWATNVVCGRARLAGIPMAAIAVETRTMELVVPADPATPDSETQVPSSPSSPSSLPSLPHAPDACLGHPAAWSGLVPQLLVQDGAGHLGLQP